MWQRDSRKITHHGSLPVYRAHYSCQVAGFILFQTFLFRGWGFLDLFPRICSSFGASSVGIAGHFLTVLWNEDLRKNWTNLLDIVGHCQIYTAGQQASRPETHVYMSCGILWATAGHWNTVGPGQARNSYMRSPYCIHRSISRLVWNSHKTQTVQQQVLLKEVHTKPVEAYACSIKFSRINPNKPKLTPSPSRDR